MLTEHARWVRRLCLNKLLKQQNMSHFMIQEIGTFLKDNPPPVFIDEIQYAPNFFLHIKMISKVYIKNLYWTLCRYLSVDFISEPAIICI